MNETSRNKAKKISAAEAWIKIQHYCAYQERAHREVKSKLFSYGLHEDEVDEIISRLIVDGFVNEERFAKAYAGGKFRMKKWGLLKIKNELEQLGLTRKCIEKGLKEIDQDDYQQSIKTLIHKKSKEISDSNPYKRKEKIARYIIGKGYEPELVWEYIREMVKD